MRIRSITYFINPSNQLELKIARAATMARQTKESLTICRDRSSNLPHCTHAFFDMAGYRATQASIGATTSTGRTNSDGRVRFRIHRPGIIRMPAGIRNDPRNTESTNLFATGMLTTARKALDTRAVKACARIIYESASASPDGFTNLRFAALGNVPACSPFFPSAYASPRGEGFGLAIEGADLAVETFANAKNVLEAQKMLIAQINTISKKLIEICSPFSEKGMEFLGIDFTLAPYPGDDVSIGKALENLGVSSLGMAGSVTAASILMSVMQQVKIPRIGFNGLMTPVLEDSILAKRAADGTLGIQDLLLYATVCGTGLDTIPLPGDTHY